MNELIVNLIEQSRNLDSELIELRRHLHQYPELSWNEVETSTFLKKNLVENGLTPINGIATHGFYVDIKGDHSGPTLAWRADMDALPIKDHKTTSYASKISGRGHMCGHDAHSTMALAIARLAAKNRDKLAGTLRVFWQPAEESQPSGAPEMIKDGVLQNVSQVYGAHMDPTLTSGAIGLRKGPVTASVDSFKIKVIGSTTLHSARPHMGEDVVWIANQLVGSLYPLTSRMTDVRDPSILSICTFHAGDAHNVLPSEAEFSGTLRTTSSEARKLLLNQIRSICSNYEAIYRVSIQIEFFLGAPPVTNHAGLTKSTAEILKNVVAPKDIVTVPISMGAEDFAFYTVEKPAVFFRIGSCKDEATSHPLHSYLFDIDESVLAPTAAKMVYVLFNQSKELSRT